MQPNNVKTALHEGRAVSGPIVNEARSVSFVKMMAQAGHDFLFFDMEHAMFNWETVFNLVQMSLVSGITPFIRVTDLSYPLVARALDSGAQGVIIPRVETKQQVENAVSFARYPPLGRRGAGGESRYGYVRRDPGTAIEEANAEVMVIVQVESELGVANLDDMASVPGVDVVLVGPQDLSISLGIAGQTTHPRFIETVQSIVETCKARGVPVGQVEREAVAFQRWFDMGIRLLCCNTDANMMFQSAARDVAALREFTG